MGFVRNVASLNTPISALDFSLWSPGPRLFLSCPIDVDGSRVWFTDLWNYSIIPYLLEAVREGLQVRNTLATGLLKIGGHSGDQMSCFHLLL